MTAVEVRRWGRSNEELTAIGVFPAICHRQEEGTVVLHRCEVLVVESAAVYGLATCAVAVDEVATLSHEALDDPENNLPLIVVGLW